MTDEKTKRDLRDDESIVGKTTSPSETGLGATIDASARGALMGAAAGPVSAIVGAAAGIVVGGFGDGENKESESIDPAGELEHWRENYVTRDYYDPNVPFSDFEPAYRLAIENFRPGCRFEDCEAELHSQWEVENANGRLSWSAAKQAMQDAWHQLRGQSSNEQWKKPR